MLVFFAPLTQSRQELVGCVSVYGPLTKRRSEMVECIGVLRHFNTRVCQSLLGVLVFWPCSIE